MDQKGTREQVKYAERLELRDFQEELTKPYKKIHCPSCEQEILAADINLEKSVAKCSGCNAIFCIKDDLKDIKPGTAIAGSQEILRPEGIDLFHYRDTLDVVVQQHIQGVDLGGIILFPAMAFLLLILYFGKGIPILFPAISIFGSLFFLYRVLNYRKNKTYIEVSPDYLSIRSRPRHFSKDKVFATKQIDQLYLKVGGDGVGHCIVFMIVNSPGGQKHEKLIQLNTLSKGKYLEQQIEKYLGIEQRDVPEATA